MSAPQTINIPVMDVLGDQLLTTVRNNQDPFAREIFDLWFSGNAPSEVIRDDDRWAKYMLAAADLDRQIDEGLAKVAERRYADFCKRYPGNTPSRVAEVFIENFHVEIAGKAGGYDTGYALLHGSNRTVGDFEVRGLVSLQRPLGATGPTATFSMLKMTFNDIMDPNLKYRMDGQLDYIFRSMGRAKNGRVPRPFTLRIKWSDPKLRSFSLPIKRDVFGKLANLPPLPRSRY